MAQASTMDRLLMPELLPDIDALALVDLAELYDVELDDAPLAARASVGHDVRSGLGNPLRSGRRLSESPGAVNEMRADAFTREFVPFVEHCGLNDQEVLNCYAGSTYHPPAPAWNMWPAQETVREPRILRWAGHQKPWNDSRYVLERERWDEAEAAVETRRRGTHVA